MVNGGEIGFAIFPGWCADTNKNRISCANGFSGVASIRNAPCFARGCQDSIEMLFVNGNNAGIQLGDALGIDVHANYLVSRFREARSSNQSHITTPDYTDMQGETPFKQSGKRWDIALNRLAVIIAEWRADWQSTGW